MGSKLKVYRFLAVPSGHAIAGEREIKCLDDAEALIECHKMLASCQSAEAWDGNRLVCRMSRTGRNANERNTRPDRS